MLRRKKSETVSSVEGSAINPNGINITVQNTQTSAQPQGQMVVGSGKIVNKTTYILLALFLGGLGIHKFYAGKIFAGILFAVFVWTGVPSFIALIELIIAAFKPADAQGNIVV